MIQPRIQSKVQSRVHEVQSRVQTVEFKFQGPSPVKIKSHQQSLCSYCDSSSGQTFDLHCLRYGVSTEKRDWEIWCAWPHRSYSEVQKLWLSILNDARAEGEEFRRSQLAKTSGQPTTIVSFFTCSHPGEDGKEKSADYAENASFLRFTNNKFKSCDQNPFGFIWSCLILHGSCPQIPFLRNIPCEHTLWRLESHSSRTYYRTSVPLCLFEITSTARNKPIMFNS